MAVLPRTSAFAEWRQICSGYVGEFGDTLRLVQIVQIARAKAVVLSQETVTEPASELTILAEFGIVVRRRHQLELRELIYLRAK